MALDPYERLARDGSLAAALDSLSAELEAGRDPAASVLFERFIGWLRSGVLGLSTLTVGDPLPDFVLPDQDGRLVTSAELLADGPLILSFFRGGWCPYCGLEMVAIEQARPEIEAAGAQIIGISPEILRFPADTIKERGLRYRLLADADNGLALLLGLVFRMPQGIIDRYKSRGLDLAERHGNDGWMVPIPGTFLVDRGGIVRLAFADPDYRVRLEPAALIEALRSL
jgi:peroxiredoxin